MSLPWRPRLLPPRNGGRLPLVVKRRFGLKPSGMTLGLDGPESLFPRSLQRLLANLVLTLPVCFVLVGELATSRLFFAVGLRDRPY